MITQVHIWFLARQAASERWDAGSTGPSKLLAILHMSDTMYLYSLIMDFLRIYQILVLCSCSCSMISSPLDPYLRLSAQQTIGQSVQQLPCSFFSKFLKSGHTCLSFGLDTNLSGTVAAVGCSGRSPTFGTAFA